MTNALLSICVYAKEAVWNGPAQIRHSTPMLLSPVVLFFVHSMRSNGTRAQKTKFRTWAGFTSPSPPSRERDQESAAMYAVRYILREGEHGKPLPWLHLCATFNQRLDIRHLGLQQTMVCSVLHLSPFSIALELCDTWIGSRPPRGLSSPGTQYREPVRPKIRYRAATEKLRFQPTPPVYIVG